MLSGIWVTTHGCQGVESQVLQNGGPGTQMGPPSANVTPNLSTTQVQMETRGRAGVVQRGAQSKLGRNHCTRGCCSHWGSHEGLWSVWGFRHDPDISCLTLYILHCESQTEARGEEVTLISRVNSKALLALTGFRQLI